MSVKSMHELTTESPPVGLAPALEAGPEQTSSASVTQRGGRYSLLALLTLPVAATTVLLLVPLVVLLRFSFLVNIPGRGLSDQLTLDNYAVLFTNAYFRGGIILTVVTALLVTAICLVLAFPVAYAYARTSVGPKGLLLIAILSPFYIDILVRVYAWMVLLGRGGLVDQLLLATGLLKTPVDFRSGYLGIVIILIYITLPFMILSLIGPLQSIDDGLIEAARVCGAPPGRVFGTVVLPLSIPGVVAGTILAFSVGISAFIVPLLVGGRIGQQFLGVLVYDSMNINQDWALGAAAAAVLLVLSLVTVALYNWMVKSLKVGVVIGGRLAA
ncbi:MAG: ABC transporter permease [Chloroflexota bacterium]|nr:ABC transporter permease [Chloroflexota bacterium]